MVELAHPFRRCRQGLQIALQSVHPLLVPGLPAGGSEGINMSDSQILRPGHFIAENAHKRLIRHGLRGSLARGPFLADGCAICVHGTLPGIVKGVAVIRHREEVQVLHLFGIGEGFCHISLAVGNIGMGMQLAEIEIPVTVQITFRHLDFRHHHGIHMERTIQQDTLDIHPVTDFNTLRHSSLQLAAVAVLRQNPIAQNHTLHQNPYCIPAFRQCSFLYRQHIRAGFFEFLHR